MATVLEARHDRVLVLTLNRPDRLNAVSEALYEELLTALDRAATDPAVRAVVITGADRAFCVGADLKTHGEDARGDAARRAYVELGQRAANAIVSSPLPILAAINGHAIGAGLELALACDLGVVASDAKLRFPELGLGTFVGGGVTATLPARIGLGAARELLLRCAFFSGTRAVELGMFGTALPAAEVLEHGIAIAREIASKAPRSVAHLKNLLRPTPRTFEATLAAEADALLDCMGTADWREGVAAFAERREPHFRGD